MGNLVKWGRGMFAAGFTGLAILCFIYGDFIVGRPPAWPARFSAAAVLGYITATVLMLSIIAIVTWRYAVQAACTMAALIVCFSISRHVPAFMDTWLNTFKSIALTGGCLIIAASYIVNGGTAFSLSLAVKLRVAGTIMLAVFFAVCGYAHFKYAAFVDILIPAYIPFHAFWTYGCGIFLIAGGMGMLVSSTRRLAALLCGIMIGGWFLLLHVPRFLTNTNDASDRMGLFESFAFAGICFCLAGLLVKENKFAAPADNPVNLSEAL